MRKDNRALLFFVPLFLLALVSGVTPAVSGLLQSLSGEGRSLFRLIAADRALVYSLKISTVWTACATFGVLFLAVPIAVSLHLNRRLFLPAVIILAVPWVIPVFIAGPVWRLFFHGVNGESLWSSLTGVSINLLTQPVASFLSVLFTSIWRNLPPSVFILYAAIRKIPRSSIEAASMDGASQWQMVRLVLLPQVRQFLVVLAVVNLVEGFGEFTLPFVMTAGGPPLMRGITATYVVGATTTVEIYLYDLFQMSGKLTLPVVYSTVTLAAFFALAGVWMAVRRRGGRLSLAAVLALAALLLFDRSAPGLMMAGILLAGWTMRWLRRLPVSLASWAYIVYGIIRTASDGLLAGFQPALLPLLFIAAGAFTAVRTAWRRRAWPRGLRAAGGGLHSSSGGNPHSNHRPPRDHQPPAARPLDTATRRLSSTAWVTTRVVAMLVTAVSVVLFVYLLVWVSFSGLNSVFVDSFVPRFFTTGNYAALLADASFHRALLNTVGLALATALLAIIVTFPAAAAAATRFRGRGAGRKVFLSLQFLRLSGGIHSLIPLFAVFLTARLIDTHVPLVLLYAFQAAPVAFIVLHSFIKDLPPSLHDAARMAGASTLRYYTRILLPVCAPPAATAGLLAFLAAWNGFLIPLVFLTDQQKFPLSIYLHNAVGSVASGTPAWGVFAAGSVLNLVVLVLIFVATRRPLLSTSASQIE